MKRVLSIDGGGIRGILPAVILSNIEKRAQLIHNNRELRIADLFDIIAGTSTGGILTSLYLTPGENSRPKYNANQIVDLYKELGPILFQRSFLKKLKSLGGLKSCRYSNEALIEFSYKTIGDKYISEAIKDCLITSYDISSRKALLFSKYSQKKYEDMAQYRIADIAVATASAPGYFSPYRVFAKDGGSRTLIDGGVYANNPTSCALVECFKIWPESTPKDIYILSIGTGKVIKPYYYNNAKKFGFLRWAVPILDIMMSSTAETVDYQIDQIFNIFNSSNNYIRIEPKMLDADSRIDNASNKNIERLINAANNYIDHNSHTLDNIVNSLFDIK